MEARMGRKRVVVVTLLVHSVKMATRRLKRKAMAAWGMVCKGVSLLPSQSDKPEAWKKGVESRGIVGAVEPSCLNSVGGFALQLAREPAKGVSGAASA